MTTVAFNSSFPAAVPTDKVSFVSPSSLFIFFTLLFSTTSTPSFSASSANALSKTSRFIAKALLSGDGTSILNSYECERTIAPFSSLFINGFTSFSSLSSNALLLISPAHWTGSPIFAPFSTISVEAPAFAAYFAAMQPEGPAPTTTTSYLSITSS